MVATTSPVGAGPPIAAMVENYDQWIALHRELTVMRRDDSESHAIIVFVDGATELAKTLPPVFVALQKEWKSFEYGIALTNHDPRLGQFSKEGDKDSPTALIIQRGVVVKVAKIKDAKHFGERCKAWRGGESGTHAFGPQYGKPHKITLEHVFGYQAPDYCLNSMEEMVEMWMRLQYNHEVHPGHNTCVLLYEEANEDKMRIKTQWDTYRKRYAEIEFPAVKVDRDPRLKEFATSQNRRLPAVLEMIGGEVEHVSYVEDLSKYTESLHLWSQGANASTSFEAYNGSTFRMKIGNNYVGAMGIGVICTMPSFVDFNKRVKDQGIAFPDQRVMALMYDAASATNEVVKKWREELPKRFRTVDFIEVCSDDKIDSRVGEALSIVQSKLPAALVIQGGMTKCVTAVDVTDKFEDQVEKWVNGTPALAAFDHAPTLKSQPQLPMGLVCGKATPIEMAHTTTGYLKMMRRMQEHSQHDNTMSGCILIVEGDDPRTLQMTSAIKAGIKVEGTVEYGMVNVQHDKALKQFTTNNGQRQLPALTAIEAGKTVAIVFVKNVEELVNYLQAWRGKGGSAPAAFSKRQVGPTLKSPAKAMRNVKANKPVQEITTWGGLLAAWTGMLGSKKTPDGKGLMTLYRESDKNSGDTDYILDMFATRLSPAIEYRRVNISHDQMLAGAIISQTGRVPAALLFENSKAYVCPVDGWDRLYSQVQYWADGDTIEKAFEGEANKEFHLAGPTLGASPTTIEQTKGQDGLQKLIMDFHHEHLEKSFEKGVVVLYSKRNDKHMFLVKLFISYSEDWPSIRVGMCNADDDAWLADMSDDAKCDLPWMVIYEDGIPRWRYAITDAGDLTRKMKAWQAGKDARDVFVAPMKKGAEKAANVIKAVYHRDAETQARKRCQLLTCQAPTVLFMKGDKDDPACKFSAEAVRILEAAGIDFDTDDIMQNQRAREELKEYSDWPTFPQLYHHGEFIGGVDIIRALAKSGDLAHTLE